MSLWVNKSYHDKFPGLRGDILTIMKIIQQTLSNGLRVVFIHSHGFPTITSLLLLNAGSRYENAKNQGMAHFLEHMPFKGSKKYPSPFVIANLLDGIGGMSNAFTSKDYVGYWTKATLEEFPKTLDVLADVVLNPLLDEKEIEKEKGVITEEINMYEDKPDFTVSEIFETLLYPNHPLGRSSLGTKQTVNSFTRDTFTDFRKPLYFANNAVLVVAGGVTDSDKMLRTIEKEFGGWEHKKVESYEETEDQQTEPQVLLKKKNIEQAHFCLGFRAFSMEDKRKYALMILSVILGKGFSSRLFTEIREKRGLCYHIGSYTHHFTDVGYITTQAAVKKNGDEAKKAVEATLLEHYRLRDEGITDEELQKAKKMLKGRILLQLEDSFEVAYTFGKKLLLQNGMETIEELVQAYEKVTKDDVLSVAQEILVPKKLNLALVGPFEESQAFNDVLSR